MKIKPYKRGDVLVFDASTFEAPNKSERLVATVMQVHKEGDSYAYSMLISDLSDMTPYWVPHEQLSPATDEDITEMLGKPNSSDMGRYWMSQGVISPEDEAGWEALFRAVPVK